MAVQIPAEFVLILRTRAEIIHTSCLSESTIAALSSVNVLIVAYHENCGINPLYLEIRQDFIHNSSFLIPHS